MGIPKAQATSILNDIFKVGNTIALLTELDVDNETFTEVSGSKTTNGYVRHAIENGEFSTSSGVTVSADNILYGLAIGNWGTVVGFAVYNGSTLKYLAELTSAMTINGSSDPVVPVFRTYDADKGYGIRVSLDRAEATATASSI